MSLLSVPFLLLAALAILWLRGTRGRLREAGFLVLSAVFAASYLGPVGSLSTALFCLAGFGAARLVERHPRRLAPAVAVLTLTFLVMRAYDFLVPVLPRSLAEGLLATAGLSFLFFKILHVVIDASAGTLGPLRAGRYACYCLNFTTFLLGPIQRYQDFSDQWDGRKAAIGPGFDSHLDAFNRMLRGFVKKFVVAEFLARYALLPGAGLGDLGPLEALQGTYLFYLFLYFDFSGYCDIVIGIGSLMGIRPPENFDLPFFSGNIAAFWLRVHRSLTTWLTEYVFNPLYARALRSASLGRHKPLAASCALLGTMLVSGLWHGTTFNFVLFGLVHGIYLSVYRSFELAMIGRIGRKGLRQRRRQLWWRAAAWLVTFHASASAYLFFVLDGPDLKELWHRCLG